MLTRQSGAGCSNVTPHTGCAALCSPSPGLCSVAGSSASGGSQTRKDKEKGNGQDRKSPGGSGSETETGSVISQQRQRAPPTERSLPPPPRQLDQTNQELNASRQSFRMAMGNPCEYRAYLCTRDSLRPVNMLCEQSNAIKVVSCDYSWPLMLHLDVM